MYNFSTITVYSQVREPCLLSIMPIGAIAGDERPGVINVGGLSTGSPAIGDAITRLPPRRTRHLLNWTLQGCPPRRRPPRMTPQGACPHLRSLIAPGSGIRTLTLCPAALLLHTRTRTALLPHSYRRPPLRMTRCPLRMTPQGARPRQLTTAT